MDINMLDVQFIDDEEFYEPSEEFELRYHDIQRDDMQNGEGLRVILWLSGCSHRCPGCQNPQTWNPNSGVPFTAWDQAELFEALDKEYIQGLTISGGDPLFAANRAAVGQLLKDVKKVYPAKDIWLYTGYSLKHGDDGWFFEDECPWLKNHDRFEIDWLELIDVLVDGPYMADIRKIDVESKRDPNWCGSSNQHVIDIKKTIKQDSIVLFEEKEV